jgi:hypothetical protein
MDRRSFSTFDPIVHFPIENHLLSKMKVIFLSLSTIIIRSGGGVLIQQKPHATHEEYTYKGGGAEVSESESVDRSPRQMYFSGPAGIQQHLDESTTERYIYI